MTIPRNRTFKNSKGFQAQADVGINSPVQTNSQQVNVILSPQGLDHKVVNTDASLTKDKAFPTLNRANTEFKEIDIASDANEGVTTRSAPLCDNIETVPSTKERSIESAQLGLEEMQALLKDKDNLIEALSLILDIYENNPFIVNKLIVAKEDELTRLLFLLTGAEQIELIKTEQEIGCCIKAEKYIHIQKIMVKKGNNTYNFKYSFPNVVQLLDNRKITWKLVY